MSETNSMSDLSAEKVVAELRDEQFIRDGLADGTLRSVGATAIVTLIAKIDQQADLIAHQAARLEEMQAETRRIQAAALVHIDEMTAFQRKTVVMERERDDAKAALTAAEAEVGRLQDPVAVHVNMLRGTIAKPSLMNIAHLYPEVQRMKQALVATLKHFRWPTSAEHETRDQVMAALAPFDDPPLSRAALSEKEQGDG